MPSFADTDTINTTDTIITTNNPPYTDDDYCAILKQVFEASFNVQIIGGAEEPFYQAPTKNTPAIIYYKANYPRSLLHEMAHYCLAGQKRRQLDDYGYWYAPCGRTAEQQQAFENVEARPQALEKAFCQHIGLPFCPSLDDFSGKQASETFVHALKKHHESMMTNPPPSAKKALQALSQCHVMLKQT